MHIHYVQIRLTCVLYQNNYIHHVLQTISILRCDGRRGDPCSSRDDECTSNSTSQLGIYCIKFLCAFQDYMDAFEKIAKLGLNKQQNRELVRVIMDCCAQV